MCTIALAKVQRNYNCYNVYFYECLRILFLFLQTERRGRGYVPPSFFGGIFNLRLPNMLIANVLRFDVRRVNMDYNPPYERRAILG